MFIFHNVIAFFLEIIGGVLFTHIKITRRYEIDNFGHIISRAYNNDRVFFRGFSKNILFNIFISYGIYRMHICFWN